VKISKKHARIYNEPLSRREVRLLADWERERRSSVTADDVRRLVGDASKDVILSLTRKGALQRVKGGVFLVRPFRTLLRPTSTSAVVQAAVLLQSEPYYLGGAWALTFHGLTEQQQVSVLDAFVTKRRPARRLTAARLVFHPIAATLVKYGTAETTIESVTVRVSDLERTLLDALDHPDVVGSVDRAVNLVIRALPRADRFFRGLGPSCRSERTGARWHDKACRRARISGRTAPLTVSQAARFCALRSPDDRPRYSPPHCSRTMQLLSRRDHGLALACDRAEPGRFVLSSSNSSASRPATRDISRRCSSHRQRPREGARMICCVTYLRT